MYINGKYYDTRSTYYVIYGGFEKNISTLLKWPKEALIALIVNDTYNSFLSDWANKGNDDSKLVPYIGWFYRSTDWYNKDIPIGDCGKFIGIMENNKWNYSERKLTVGEVDQVIAIVDEAMMLSRKGGMLSEIQDNTKKALEKLWPLFQTFKVERDGY